MSFRLLLIWLGLTHFAIFLILHHTGFQFLRTTLRIICRPIKDAEVAPFTDTAGVEFFVHMRALRGEFRATFCVVAISAKTECIVFGICVLALSYFAFRILPQFLGFSEIFSCHLGSSVFQDSGGSLLYNYLLKQRSCLKFTLLVTFKKVFAGWFLRSRHLIIVELHIRLGYFKHEVFLFLLLNLLETVQAILRHTLRTLKLDCATASLRTLELHIVTASLRIIEGWDLGQGPYLRTYHLIHGQANQRGWLFLRKKTNIFITLLKAFLTLMLLQLHMDDWHSDCHFEWWRNLASLPSPHITLQRSLPLSVVVFKLKVGVSFNCLAVFDEIGLH